MANVGFFERYKVGTRIYGGFAVVLLLLGVVGWAGFDGLNGADRGLSEYARVSNNTVFVMSMALSTQEMRRHVLVYTYTGSPEALKRIREMQSQIKQQLDDFESRTSNPARKKITGDLKTVFETYGGVFERLVELKRGRDQATTEQLEPAGTEIRKRFDQIIASAVADASAEDAADAGATQEAVLLARLQVQRVLNATAPAVMEEARKRLAGARKSVDALPATLKGEGRKKLAAEAATHFAKYLETYAAVESQSIALADLIGNQLPQIGTQFGQLIEGLRQSQIGLNGDPDHFKGSQKFTEQKTRDGVGTAEQVALIFTLVAFVLGLIAARLIARSITTPVAGVREVMVKLAEGHLDVAVPHTGGRDEIAEMARAVDSFKEVSTSAVRAGCALDQVTANVMMVDTGGRITYVNPALGRMLNAAAADIRQVLPDFDPDTLIGRKFEDFHRQPERQRQMIEGLTTTLQSEAKVGRRTFRVIANPVVSRLGVRLGTVVEWRDLTDELAIEDEIKGIVDGARRGDLSRRVALEGKAGFFRAISEGINGLAGTISEVSEDLAASLNGLANGDLSQRIDKHYEGVFLRLKDDYNATAEKLAEVVGRITTATQAISAASAEVSAGSADLSERTEQQASNLEETAAAMEELGATTRSNADNALEANRMAAEAKLAAEHGGRLAGSAVDSIKRIEQASRKITEIIGVIDEIAFQTNLLALNAAVEAARAGDAGKGFAVVAQEVRVLAQRSAQASKEIKTLITASDSQVRDGVEMVQKAGAALGGIVSSVNRVADMIEEMATASSEQASAIDEINSAVAQLDEMTQKNAALVEETTAASQAMAGQSRDLRDLMAFFITKADGGATSMNRHIALVEATKIDHVNFRKRVDDSLAGHGDATADNLPDHHQCRLGKWYDAMREPAVRQSPAFAAIAQPHAAVHEAARKALRQNQAGDRSGVQQALGTMTENSKALMGILDKLAGDLRSQSRRRG